MNQDNGYHGYNTGWNGGLVWDPVLEPIDPTLLAEGGRPYANPGAQQPPAAQPNHGPQPGYVSQQGFMPQSTFTGYADYPVPPGARQARGPGRFQAPPMPYNAYTRDTTRPDSGYPGMDPRHTNSTVPGTPSTATHSGPRYPLTMGNSLTSPTQTPVPGPNQVPNYFATSGSSLSNFTDMMQDHRNDVDRAPSYSPMSDQQRDGDVVHDVVSDQSMSTGDTKQLPEIDFTGPSDPGAVNGVGQAQGSIQPNNSASTNSNQLTPKWDGTISTLKDALEQLSGSGTTRVEMKVEDDDVEDVKDGLMQYALDIFNVLLERPTSIPTSVKVADHHAWWAKQDRARGKCAKMMLDKEDAKDAQARCIIIIDTVIKLHKNGIPVRQLEEDSKAKYQKEEDSVAKLKSENDRKRITNAKVKGVKKALIKTTGKYTINRGIKCTERIGKIVDAVRDSKQVALDVLDGEKKHIHDLVRAPDAYANQKRQHFRNNQKRGEMLADGKAYRQKMNAASTPASRKSTATTPAGTTTSQATPAGGSAFEGDDEEGDAPYEVESDGEGEMEENW